MVISILVSLKDSIVGNPQILVSLLGFFVVYYIATIALIKFDEFARGKQS